MALPMVHLAVARLAAQKLNIHNWPSYYLGSIAPDGIHMLDGWTKADKNHSHLGTRGGHDPAAVGEFLKRLPEWENRDYALGYAVHILTDIEWGWSMVKGTFDLRRQEDPSPVMERSQAYYNDADQIDLELYANLPEREEIWRALRQAEACDLPGVLPKEAAELWNTRTLNWYEEPRSFAVPAQYLHREDVMEFISRAGKLCGEFVLKYLGEERSPAAGG